MKGRHIGVHIVNNTVCGDIYEHREQEKGCLEVSWVCDGCNREPGLGEVQVGGLIVKGGTVA